MYCEIISIGSELTSGRNLDTNSQWLSQRLAEMGIGVGWHTTVADDLDANVEVFRIASRRASLVLATGGLGPTQDDLTREALARVAGVDLVLHPESLAQIEEMFRRRGREMPERNRVQAMFPVGAEPIPNSCGTAPGIWMQLGGCVVAAMPGVPSEMHAMFENSVRPRLQEVGMTGGVLIQRKINTFGLGESHIEEKLFDLTQRGHVPEVGITASDAVISLRILAHGATLQEALDQAAPVEQVIRERLGTLVYGVGDEELHDVVVRLLIEQGKTIATAESITAGLVADRLACVPGASKCLYGGVVAYHNSVKADLLGVPQRMLDEHGAVSLPVVEAMAVGARTRMKTDLAVSTVGVAGPGDLGPNLPAGLVHVGLAWEGGTRTATYNWTGTRAEVRRRTAKMALNLVRLHLLNGAK